MILLFFISLAPFPFGVFRKKQKRWWVIKGKEKILLILLDLINISVMISSNMQASFSFSYHK